MYQIYKLHFHHYVWCYFQYYSWSKKETKFSILCIFLISMNNKIMWLRRLRMQITSISHSVEYCWYFLVYKKWFITFILICFRSGSRNTPLFIFFKYSAVFVKMFVICCQHTISSIPFLTFSQNPFILSYNTLTNNPEIHFFNIISILRHPSKVLFKNPFHFRK